MSDRVILSHGDGGKRSRELIDKLVARFDNPMLSPLYDSSFLGGMEGETAFTTDSYVVSPPFFPGGDIGVLSICGTVNDLSVCGAKPVAISCSLILEEGFPMKSLIKIADSMADTANIAGVPITCGDTKVVERGKGDGIFINTSGVGLVRGGWIPDLKDTAEGDRVIITGTMGDHGISVLIARKELRLKGNIESDVAPLSSLLLPLIDKYGKGIKFMRDPTRGGVGVTLNEISGSLKGRILLDEGALPVRKSVRGVCELLGFDPIYLANEGKALLIVEGAIHEEVLQDIRAHELGKEGMVIGEIKKGDPGPVLLKTSMGGLRIIDYPVGEQLPRIC